MVEKSKSVIHIAFVCEAVQSCLTAIASICFAERTQHEVAYRQLTFNTLYLQFSQM